jgi:integrase
VRLGKGYLSKLQLHVIPVIGSVKLSKVQPHHIRQVYEVARDKGLSEQTCLHIHRVLHTAFADAVRVDRVLKENPLERVRAPRPRAHEVVPIDPDHVRMLLEAARGSRLEVPVALAAVTGLRRGELLALRWRNVDLDRGSLFVAEALEQTKMHGVRFKAPKSKSSRRTIPLAPETVDMLRTYKSRQDDERRQARWYVDNDLVFCNVDGEPWPPDSFTSLFGKLARGIGLKGFRFHDLRHSFASLTLADGRPIKEVQTLMGHSTANTTLSVYARTIEGLGREAVTSLTRSLFSVQG